MRKALRLATAAGLSVLLLFGVIINDDFRGSSRRWTFTEERHCDSATEEVSIEDDSFAGRRRHLDSVCDKYDDIYRPEYYNLYRKVYGHGIIIFIDNKTKCRRHLKKLTCKGTLQQVLIRVYDWRYSQTCWYFRSTLLCELLPLSLLTFLRLQWSNIFAKGYFAKSLSLVGILFLSVFNYKF
jgi:hypothetical protein